MVKPNKLRLRRRFIAINAASVIWMVASYLTWSNVFAPDPQSHLQNAIYECRRLEMPYYNILAQCIQYAQQSSSVLEMRNSETGFLIALIPVMLLWAVILLGLCLSNYSDERGVY